MLCFPISEHRKCFVVDSWALWSEDVIFFRTWLSLCGRVHRTPVLCLWWLLGVAVARDAPNPPPCQALGTVLPAQTPGARAGWADNGTFSWKAPHLC